MSKPRVLYLVRCKGRGQIKGNPNDSLKCTKKVFAKSLVLLWPTSGTTPGVDVRCFLFMFPMLCSVVNCVGFFFLLIINALEYHDSRTSFSVCKRQKYCTVVSTSNGTLFYSLTHIYEEYKEVIRQEIRVQKSISSNKYSKGKGEEDRYGMIVYCSVE